MPLSNHASVNYDVATHPRKSTPAPTKPAFVFAFTFLFLAGAIPVVAPFFVHFSPFFANRRWFVFDTFLIRVGCGSVAQF